MKSNYMESTVKQLKYYKKLGEQAMVQVPEDSLFWQYNGESNSIAIIVKHLWGNMLSRWTNFLSSDGEKEWRERDAEFENDLGSREKVMEKWEEGWQRLFEALEPLSEEDLKQTVYIRNQGHTVTEAIQRQMTHYTYHVGQIVYVAKMIVGEEWESLSIPRGESQSYNKQKFSASKERKHYTDEYLDEG